MWKIRMHSQIGVAVQTTKPLPWRNRKFVILPPLEINTAQKLLVANRGEIALRIMRSAREMGITTVAIYSEADANAPHALFADEAYCIGPAPSNQSYLQGDKIIALCKEHGIDAIHPGYGFLSENSGFARQVREAGIIFVGPSPESMDMMGSKIAAKIAARNSMCPWCPALRKRLRMLRRQKRWRLASGSRS
jgi:acetyl-CoA carboxylase biotin carboxylase subunit